MTLTSNSIVCLFFLNYILNILVNGNYFLLKKFEISKKNNFFIKGRAEVEDLLQDFIPVLELLKEKKSLEK